MKKKIKDFMNNWLLIIPIMIVIIILFAFLGLEVYTWIEYGGKPASEIPGWVWWLWFSGNN